MLSMELCLLTVSSSACAIQLGAGLPSPDWQLVSSALKRCTCAGAAGLTEANKLKLY